MKPRVSKITSGDNATMAFSRPGGEVSKRARSRPLDLGHLSRQTMGDRKLEEEVLAMFSYQIAGIRNAISVADEAGRCRLAHNLKGTARNVGAFSLADCAEHLENDAGNKAIHSRLVRLIDEVRDYIAAISR